MVDFLFVLLLGSWSAAVGSWLLNRLGQRPDRTADALALAVPLGLGLLALCALGLSELGGLSRTGLLIVLGFAIVVCSRGAAGRAWWVIQHWSASNSPGLLDRQVTSAPLVPTLCVGTREPASGVGGWLEVWRCSWRDAWIRVSHRLGLLDIAVAGLLAVTLLGTLLTSLAPVTDGDALCYHLQVPKVFLWQGSPSFDPDLHETVYPLLTEMLYAVALAFRGPVACRLIQWMLGLVFAANVTALARPNLGNRAWWAGAIALLVPAVSNGMSAPLNDVALAAFGTAAIAASARHLDQPTIRSATLAGLLAGLALGVKYPALVLTALLALAIVSSAVLFGHRPRASLLRAGLPPLLGAGLQTPPPGRPKVSPHDQLLGEGLPAPPREMRARPLHAAVFCATALLIGGSWYLRAYIHTGNPVYPFFRHVFGGAGLDEVLDPIKRPMTVNLVSLLTALGPLTLHPDRFDSFSHQFGPVFLLFLPALLLERAPRRILAIATLGYLFLALCLTQRQSMRFVLIAIGPMSVAVAWLAQKWWERRSVAARVLLAALTLMLGFEASLSAARARHGLKVVLGRESAEQFLTRREPTYRVARWADENLPSVARLVGQDHRGYYFPRPYTMELAHRRRTGLGTRAETGQQVVDRLRSAGFTHVMLCPPVPESAVEFDPTLGRLLSTWLVDQAPLYREEIVDPDGVVRRYAIYELTNTRLAKLSTGGDRR